MNDLMFFPLKKPFLKNSAQSMRDSASIRSMPGYSVSSSTCAVLRSSSSIFSVRRPDEVLRLAGQTGRSDAPRRGGSGPIGLARALVRVVHRVAGLIDVVERILRGTERSRGTRLFCPLVVAGLLLLALLRDQA